MPTPEQTFCVFLRRPGHGDDGSPPSFAELTWDVCDVDDPVLAMAELAVRERAQAARSAWGLQRHSNLAMAIEEPHQWPQLPELLEAVARYLPEVKVWAFEHGRLSCVDLPAVDDARKPLSAPAAHLNPDSAPTQIDSPAKADMSPSISAEELDMLLEMTGDQHQ